MFARMPLVLSTLAASLLFAADASASGVSIGFSKHGKHGSIGIQIGAPVCAPRPAPPVYGGRWETIVERVWVPGHCERVWVEPVYAWEYDACGRRVQVCVRAGYWNTIQHPGHYEERYRKVWRDGHGRRHHGPGSLDWDGWDD
jgi:hypothetical protein